MQISKEMLQKQMDTVKLNMDGYMQGYLAALAFVNNLIETPEQITEAPKTEEIAK